MLAVLLFTSLTLTAPNPTTVADLSVTPAQPAVKVWLSKSGWVRKGDRVKVYVRTELDGYVVVLHAEPDGRIRVLFPLDPGDDYYLRGGRDYEIRGRGDREAFKVYESGGAGTVYAAFSRDPFRFVEFVRGDHWDYQLPEAWLVDEEPDADLTAIAQLMAVGASFQFDLVRYDVGEPVAYRQGHRGYYRYYGWPYTYSPSFHVRLHFGYGYPVWYRVRRYMFCGDPLFYDPYLCGPFAFNVGYDPFFGYYDPFFPFWYDPFYYGSFFYSPYYYSPFGARYYGRRVFVGYYRGGRTRLTFTRYTFKPYERSGFGRTGIGVRKRVAPTNGTGRRVVTSGQPETTGRRIAPTGQQTAGRRLAPSGDRTTSRRIRPDGWGITDGRRTVSPPDKRVRRRSADRSTARETVTPQTARRRSSEVRSTARLVPDGRIRRPAEDGSARAATQRRTLQRVRSPSSAREVSPARRTAPGRQAAPQRRPTARSGAQRGSRSARTRVPASSRSVTPLRSSPRQPTVRSSPRRVQTRASPPSRQPAARPSVRAPRSSVRARPPTRARTPTRGASARRRRN